MQTLDRPADSAAPPITVRYTDTEARFVGAALSAYIDRLEQGAAADRFERDRLGVAETEDEATVRLVVGYYRGILRRLELAAGYPFLVESDAWDAVAGAVPR